MKRIGAKENIEGEVKSPTKVCESGQKMYLETFVEVDKKCTSPAFHFHIHDIMTKIIIYFYIIKYKPFIETTTF